MGEWVRINYNVYYAQYILHYDITMKIYYERCLVLKMFPFIDQVLKFFNCFTAVNAQHS